MAVISKGDFAKLKGWTPNNVSNLIRRGILKECLVEVKGRLSKQVDVEIAEREIAEKGDAQRSLSRALVDQRKKQATTPPPKQPAEFEDDWLEAELNGGVLASSKPKEIPKNKKEMREIEGKPTEVTVVPTSATDSVERYRGAKTSKEEYAARKLELEVAEMEGRVLDTEAVKKRITKLVGETKAALSNLPSQIAPVLVGITDVVEMETTLSTEISKALESMYKLNQTKWSAQDKEA